ncbi:MAG: hypothetical protein ABSH20_18600 [Tepidisphaeraceae bacterium]
MTAPAAEIDPRTAANRLNAQKSTGPRTAAGKAKSALNALKHGLTSQSPLLPTENPADYNLFAEGYLEELNPQAVEQFNLAQQLILTSWKLNRIPQIEAKVLAEHENRHPFIIKWRQDCADVEYQNALRRHPLPLPEKPVIPPTTTDDLIALSFFPKPPTPGTPTTGEPLGAALHRLRQYHTTLLNTYLKLLKKYEASENEPNSQTHDSLPVGSASADAAPDAPTQNEPNPDTQDSAPVGSASADAAPDAPAAQNEPNPLSAPLSTTDYQLSTPPQTPSARLHAAINAVPISSLPLDM